MPPICRPAARQRIVSAIDALEGCPTVVEPVDLLPPSKGQRDTWSLEATVDADRVPNEVLGVLAEHGLAIDEATPRGGWRRLVALVEN